MPDNVIIKDSSGTSRDDSDAPLKFVRPSQSPSLEFLVSAVHNEAWEAASHILGLREIEIRLGVSLRTSEVPAARIGERSYCKGDTVTYARDSLVGLAEKEILKPYSMINGSKSGGAYSYPVRAEDSIRFMMVHELTHSAMFRLLAAKPDCIPENLRAERKRRASGVLARSGRLF